MKVHFALSILAACAQLVSCSDCSTTQYLYKHQQVLAVKTEYATVTITESSASASADASSSSTSDSSSTSSSSSSSSSGSSQSESSVKGDLDSWEDPSEEFTDGEVSCSDFPSGQGVVSLSHLGFGGWSGVQKYLSDDATIETLSSCEEGAYCSYACQSGMSKTQWPSSQPASGVSVGGLYCKNSKLYRTNTDTKYLCEWKAKKKAVVKSKLSKSVAICRTDYPGTENMVIPTIVDGGASDVPLAVVDSASYYKWEGSLTSAQYYVNEQGLDWTTACTWGTSDDTYGNWAPVNLGASYSDSVTYLSIFPSSSSVNSNLSYKIEIDVSDGGTMSGTCSYDNGVYSGSQDGCTVGITNGYGIYVLS